MIIETLNLTDILIILLGYLFLLGTSGMIIEYIFSSISKIPMKKKVGKEALDTGFIIGKCENIIIFTFMLMNALIALAVIFAAKAIVRREDMSKNSLFFLAGTMINVTYSIIMGFVFIILLNLI